jgi:transposase-like protein
MLASRKHVGGLLGINSETLRGWIERVEVNTGVRLGVTDAESETIRALRKENAELKRANDILKVASAFFAQAELDRRLS